MVMGQSAEAIEKYRFRKSLKGGGESRLPTRSGTSSG
jgi:hypothetical protein